MPHTEFSQKVAIIGVGSPFGDDRLGLEAVNQLAQSDLRRRFPGLEIEFMQSDRPGALLLERLSGVDASIVIDAMCSGQPPGTLQTFTPEQLNSSAGLLSSHGFGVADAMALGASLGLLPRSLTIIGIEMSEDMSETPLAAVTAHRLRMLVENLLNSIQGRAQHG